MTNDESKAEPSKEDDFVVKLSTLGTGDLAILKRNAGNTLAESHGAIAGFYRIMPYGLPKYNEEIFFLVATLYGLNKYPASKDFDFGKTMRRVKEKSSESVDRRLMALLDSSFGTIDGYQSGGGELAYRLRQCVKLANSKEVGVNWVKLLKDLQYWTHESKKVQKSWAKSYFGYSPDEESKNQNKTKKE
jgi:CRISPR system Cascade subunit CasB